MPDTATPTDLQKRQLLARVGAEYLTGTPYRHYAAAMASCGPGFHCSFPACPVCFGRREDRLTDGILERMHVIDSEFLSALRLKPLFVTLTVKNVYSQDMGRALDLFASSRKILFRLMPFKLHSGYLSTVQIVAYADFNVHEHLVLFAEESAEDYICANIHEGFRRAANLDYAPDIDAKRLPEHGDVMRAIDYILKIPDVETFETMLSNRKTYLNICDALTGRRLVNPSGMFRPSFLDPEKMIDVVDD